MTGSIRIVGIGPGNLDWCAPGVIAALEKATMIVGYQTYLNQIADLCPSTPRYGNGMRREVERAEKAIAFARAGHQVAVVSGGDAGIYGMAGLILELLGLEDESIEVEVLPGITALSAAAALLGAPLMSDFAAISLSDYLVPRETIFRRLRAAASADFALCLYNPTSTKRRTVFETACSILIETLGETRPVGVVRAAFRPDQSVSVGQLSELIWMELGMDSIVIVGNSTAKIINGRMISSRGYQFTGKSMNGSTDGEN